MFERLRCRLLGHIWSLKPGMIPEDRDTYACDRCGEIRLHPSGVGAPDVPPEITGEVAGDE